MSISDDEGEQTIVINDLLSFVWCKLKLCNKEKLLDCIEKYYSKEEALQALKTLFTALPNNIKSSPSIKKSRDNPFLTILNVLEISHPDLLPTFVCKNLNNVPKFEIVKQEPKQPLGERKKEFYLEHQLIKAQLSDVFSSLYELKRQLQVLTQEKTNGQNNLGNEDKPKPSRPTSIRPKPPIKNLNYLQNLIDEDEDEELKEVLDEELEGESDDDVLEQRINLIANRRQRSSLRANKAASVSNSSKQKVIQIQKDGNTLVSDSPDLSRDILNGSFAYGVTSQIGSKNSSRYLCVEHHFDATIGAFKLYLCSECSFSSNCEDKALEHVCIKVSYEKKKGKRLLQPPTNDQQKEKATARKRKTFECHTCGAEFKLRTELTKHIETHLGGGHKCPLCNDRFPLETWLGHVKNCPGNGSTSLEDHYCEICDVFYADKRTLGFHKAFHDPSRPFECIECKFRFYTQKTVEEHFKTHKTHKNSKKCPFCEFRSNKPYKIVDHIRCHTGDKPYKCPKCERSCPSYNALKVHLTSHSATRDFPCDICGKRFKSSNKVSAHRKIHTEDRPHKCPICGKGFKIGLQMALHHRMHLDIRKHACRLCPYKARTAAILRGHMNTHTNTKPFRCMFCSFSANHKSYLNWHLRSYHKDISIEATEMLDEEIS